MQNDKGGVRVVERISLDSGGGGGGSDTAGKRRVLAVAAAGLELSGNRSTDAAEVFIAEFPDMLLVLPVG
jgi:hypothetical protein